MAANLTFEKFVGTKITDDLVAQAAELFSCHYGVWGSIAEEKIGVHQGQSFLFLKSWQREVPTDFRCPSHTQISLTEFD
jgi:hypothetical protein